MAETNRPEVFVAETTDQAILHLVGVWHTKDYAGHLPGSEFFPSQNPVYFFTRDLELLKVKLPQPDGPVLLGAVCVEAELHSGPIVRGFAEMMAFTPEQREQLRWSRQYDRPEWKSL